MSFEDIKEKDNSLRQLEESARKGQVFRNYLFVGQDERGKALAAKNFAKVINCLNEGPGPCRGCVSCRKIDLGEHPDVFFVEPKGASSGIGIGQVRDIIKRANLKPYEGKKKIFIINGAHSMNDVSSNAFLKTLEEPPEDTVFMLVSRSEEELLPTVVSRCHIIRFFASSSMRVTTKRNFPINSLLNDKKSFARELSAYSTKNELKEKLEFLISYFRDIFLSKALKEEAPIFHTDRIAEIREQSEKFTAEALGNLIEKLITLSSYVDYNVNPKLIVDVVVNDVTALRTPPLQTA